MNARQFLKAGAVGDIPQPNKFHGLIIRRQALSPMAGKMQIQDVEMRSKAVPMIEVKWRWFLAMPGLIVLMSLFPASGADEMWNTIAVVVVCAKNRRKFEENSRKIRENSRKFVVEFGDKGLRGLRVSQEGYLTGS